MTNENEHFRVENDPAAFVERALARIENEREEEEEIARILDAHFASIPKAAQHDEEHAVAPPLDGKTFLQRALTRIEQERQHEHEIIARLRAYCASVFGR